MIPKPQISASRDKIISVFSEIRTPPCENCHQINNCKANGLACGLYYCYVMNDHRARKKKHRTREPDRKHYNDLFADYVPYDEERHGP